MDNTTSGRFSRGRKILLGLFIVVLAVFILSFLFLRSSKLTFTQYENNDFSIQQPENLTPVPYQGKVIFSQPADQKVSDAIYGQFVVSRVVKSSSDTTLESLYAYAKQNNRTKGEPKKTTINSTEALVVEPAVIKGTDKMATSYYLISGSYVWEVSFVYKNSAEKFSESIPRIINSFSPK